MGHKTNLNKSEKILPAFFKKILFERQREQSTRQRARAGVRGKGRGISRLPTEQGPQCGARSHDLEIMT